MPTTGVYGGLAAAGYINAGFDTLNTCWLGATAPSDAPNGIPKQGQFWIDTSTAGYLKVKRYDGASWVLESTIDTTNHLQIAPIGGGVNSIAGAATTDLGTKAEALINITGAGATITSLGSSQPTGQAKVIVFAGINTLTYNATSLIIPGAASITTAAGDSAIVMPLGSGNWKVISYISATSNTTAISATSINGGQIAGFRNRIINGDIRIDQRFVGTSVTPSGAGTNNYIADRWSAFIQQASKLTFQQVVDAPAGFKYSLKATVAAQYTPLTGDTFSIQQRIEGQNIVDLAFGTASAQTITATIWVKGSVAGNYTCFFINGAANRSYLGVLPVTTSWVKQTVTLIGDTSGTWTTDNTTGMFFGISLGGGATFQTTTGSWQAGNFIQGSSAVQFVSQVNGSTLQFTGVQLELGSISTPFEQRPIATELAMCERYYRKSFPQGVAPAQSAGLTGCLAAVASVTTTQTMGYYWKFDLPMRASPTITTYNPSAANANWRNNGGSDVTVSVDPDSTKSDGGVLIYSTGALTVGARHYIHAAADAEL